MPKALILVANGSEEIEFVTPYDGKQSLFSQWRSQLTTSNGADRYAVLIRAGFEVKSAGINLDGEYAHMSRNVLIKPDYPTLWAFDAHIGHEYFDILILPGGAPGAKAFCESEGVLALIGNFRTAGRWVAAICAGTTALVASEKEYGSGKVKVTSHPSVAEEIQQAGWEYGEERVMVDGMVVTSRGPGTAMLFALTIVKLICGKEKMDEVAGPMMVAETL